MGGGEGMSGARGGADTARDAAELERYHAAMAEVAKQTDAAAHATDGYAAAIERAAFDKLMIQIPEVGEAFALMDSRIVNVRDAMGFLATGVQLAKDSFVDLTTEVGYYGDAVESIQGNTPDFNAGGALGFTAEAVQQINAVEEAIHQVVDAVQDYGRAIESLGEGWSRGPQGAGSPNPFGFGPGDVPAQGPDTGWMASLQAMMAQFAEGLLSILSRAFGQVAGVSGAIQGFQAGGPWGAAAGFFMEMLLRNEHMQEIIGKINETLDALFAPIAEAIAPALEAIVPLMEELKPVFVLIGAMLRIYLAPLVAVLRNLTAAIRAADPTSWSGIDIDPRTSRPSWAASGGPIRGGQLTMVGERGPEMFMPRSAGQIIPNRALGGMTINVNGIGDRELTERIRRTMQELSFTGRMGLA